MARQFADITYRTAHRLFKDEASKRCAGFKVKSIRKFYFVRCVVALAYLAGKIVKPETIPKHDD
jgi:hypothetical protein